MARMSDKPAPDTTDKGGHPNDWVRVRDPETGRHYSTTRALAGIAGAEIIPGHDALDRAGRPLPVKHNISKEQH